MPKSVYARYGSTAITGEQSVQRIYVVRGGDTLPLIAANEYQDAGYDSETWRQIAEENSIDDLDDLDVGTTLVLPPIQPVD